MTPRISACVTRSTPARANEKLASRKGNKLPDRKAGSADERNNRAGKREREREREKVELR